MKYILDRFEGDYAVCEGEDKEILNIKRNEIPLEADEGDVLVIKDGKIAVDKEETKIRKDKINKLFDSLFK